VIAYVRREPSAVLFAAQLAAMLVYPFLEENHAGRAVFSAFGIGLLALVVLAVQDSPGLTWVAVMLGVPATVLLVVQAITGSDDLFPYSSAIEALLYFYAAGALIAYMLADHVITRDELFAIGATFTLLAWAFAYTFTVVQAVEPGSFDADRTWFELLFLSVTTLTSVGLSDIVPVEPFARAVVMVAQIAGLGYVVLLVSRVIGLTIRRPDA
jgi:predicted neutral ceramidase superfamily lipid hydrolase